jgi:hypothetical protein
MSLRYLGPAAELTLEDGTVVHPGDAVEIDHPVVEALKLGGHRFDEPSDEPSDAPADALVDAPIAVEGAGSVEGTVAERPTVVRPTVERPTVEKE